MQQLLANYLFQYKNCPLSQLGTLHIESASAASEIGTQKINPPFQAITFSQDKSDTQNLKEYIAANKNISLDEADYQLKNICDEINILKEGEEFLLKGVGIFHKTSNENLIFNEDTSNTSYALPVYAERVIHPNDSHAILVGDKETDKNAMTEFFTDSETVKKNRWWIWAVVLFIISAIAIIIYMNNEHGNKLFGNSNKYLLKESPNQHTNTP